MPTRPRTSRSSGRVSKSQGRPLRLSLGDIVRWHSHLLVTATCHVWMGAVASDGYGRKRAILHQTQHAHTCDERASQQPRLGMLIAAIALRRAFPGPRDGGGG